MNTASQQRNYRGGLLFSGRRVSTPHCPKNQRHRVRRPPPRPLRTDPPLRHYHIPREECQIPKLTSPSCCWGNRSVARAPSFDPLPLSATRPQSTDASDAFNTFWKVMEQLDHVSQPLAFATTSLGLTESPQRDLGRNGSYSSDTDTEGSARSRRAFLGTRSKAQSPDGSSPTTIDDARIPDATKASHFYRVWAILNAGA